MGGNPDPIGLGSGGDVEETPAISLSMCAHTGKAM